MLALQAANFVLPLADGEDGHARSLGKVPGVVHIAIADHPGDALTSRGFSHAAQARGGDGFHEESRWGGSPCRLDDLEQLLALRDGVVVGVEDLEFESQSSPVALATAGLLVLIGVVIGERDNDTQFLHRSCLRAGNLDR